MACVYGVPWREAFPVYEQMKKLNKILIFTLLLMPVMLATAGEDILVKNLNLFYTPSQINNLDIVREQKYRIGGFVLDGSFRRIGEHIYFSLTDEKKSIRVSYVGILPDLFREGQGVVAIGKFRGNVFDFRDNVFDAEDLLVKHDGNYTPPEVSYASNTENVFSDKDSKLFFRYPDNWSERKPRFHTTLVLLYADTGSDATCNVTSKKFEELKKLSEAQLNKLRSLNHSREYFYKQLKGALPGLSVNRFWRGSIGEKDAGIIEIEYDVSINDKKIRFTQIMGSTFVNSRRITLTCNAPKHGIDSAKQAFRYIRNTMVFLD